MGTFFKVLGVLVIGVLVLAAVGWAAMRRPDVPYATLEAKYGNSASHYVDLPGGLRVHYRDQGNPAGPTIVLVHGFYASLHTWEPWVHELGRDYRLVTLDLPGHGLTRAPATWRASVDAYGDVVDAFVKSQRLDKFVLAGSSMGGDVAWRYALAHPEKVRGLVLVDSAGWPDKRPEANKADARLKLLQTPTGRLLLRDLDASRTVRAGVERSWADPSKVDRPMVDRYVELARAPGHRDIILNLFESYGTYKYATPERLAGMKVPTLVIVGGKDRLVPPENAERFAATIPGARFASYPNVGHLPQEEAPVLSASDLRAFMVSLEPKKPAAPPKPVTPKAPPPSTLIFY